MADVDVAIVGGGPAGLGAGIALRERGVGSVFVLEREAEAGGVPRHCDHPPYGLREFGRVMTGPAYARRLRSRAITAGVRIATGHLVTALGDGGVLSVATSSGTVMVHAKRVVLATGAREAPRSARMISGDRPQGVMNTATLQDGIYLRDRVPFRRPVIVGTELVALSALWTCLRHGIRPAAMIEAAGHPVARWPLGLFPRLAGTPLLLETDLIEIVGGERVDRVRVATASGVRDIECDGVLLTGSFLPEASLIRASSIAIDPATGGPSIDADGRCSDPAYFAAGNLRRPIETAGRCYREGRATGIAVAKDLGLPRSSDRDLKVRCGAAVRWIVPQRISADRPVPLDLRVDRAVDGWLTLRDARGLLWRRRLRARPERRVRVPAHAARGAKGMITIAIEA